MIIITIFSIVITMFIITTMIIRRALRARARGLPGRQLRLKSYILNNKS